MFSILWQVIKRIGRGLRWLLLILFMLLILRNSTTQFGEPYYALAAHMLDTHFDYIGWELAAIRAKTGQAAAGTHAYMTEAERSAYVRAYFDDLIAVQQIEAEINAAYTNPNITDPATTTAPLQTERDQLRASLQQRQTMTEAILQSQVSALLAEAGFGVGGQVLPPVWMRFSQPTMILVASPRDEIDMQHVMATEPIPVNERERIEQAIYAEQDLSAIIVPIGGMALYPAMIIESPSLPWIIETFAHEWLHHYLMFHPLGWETEFFLNPEARIINETTASIFGREVGRRVLERYYPDLVPPPPTTTTATPDASPRPAFDYNREMNITRVMTDKLLAKGQVDAAEHYMEARRVLFYEQGIGIRKLNQAWFSFYGGYQVSGISAGGEDPIGPAVQQLRDESDNLYEWTRQMTTLTTREALLAAVDKTN